MNSIFSPTYAKFSVKAEKHGKSHDLGNIVKYGQFLGFYSIFCLGWAKNEVHICNLHSKTQLLMYDKGEYSTKIISSQQGVWRRIRKPELEENIKIFGKKLCRNSFGGYSS